MSEDREEYKTEQANSQSKLSDGLCTLKWNNDANDNTGNILYYVVIESIGRLTVLDRETGYGYGIRDVESGYKDLDGKFWLASGDFDIRQFKGITIEQAIEKIKACANVCAGA